MIRVFKISIFIIWGVLAVVLAGNIFFHALIYLIDGTMIKFFSQLWMWIVIASALTAGSFMLAVLKYKLL